jgi:hypothetical protein
MDRSAEDFSGSPDDNDDDIQASRHHSFGSLIAQQLLANDLAAAAVAIDPAPIKGVKALPLAQLRPAFPVLGNPANRHSRTIDNGWNDGADVALQGLATNGLYASHCSYRASHNERSVV